MAYKTICDGFYFDPEVRSLPKHASDLLLYLITNPHGHFSGIYYLPLANVPVESKLSNEDIENAINVLSEDIELKQADTDRVSGIEELQKQQNQKLDRVSVFGTNKKQHFFIRYDSSRSIVFVKSMLRHQTGGRMSEKQVRSVLSHITQFSKSSVIVSFLDYHREYLRHCFLEFEKLTAGADEKKLAAGVNRRKNLKAEIEIFYQQHGLSFFCSKKYPIQPSRHEEEEAKEEAEEEAEDIVSESENSATRLSSSHSDEEKTPTNKRVSYVVDYAVAIDDIKLGFNGLLSTVEAYIVMVANKNKTKTLAQSREYGILLELSEIRKDKGNDAAFKTALLKVINKEIDNTNYFRKTLEDVKETTGGFNGSVWDSPLTN